MENKIEKIKELVQELNQARDSYYNQSKEIMTNKEYDNLYDRLNQLEKESNFILNNSPTQTVGYEIKSKLTKVQHNTPMLSLQKTKDINEVIKWLGTKEGILSWKLDGLTIITKYNNGNLIQAITRGSGVEGEDITHNAYTFINLPKQINYKGNLELRGEAIISYDDFNKINENLSLENQYQNPRNLCSGSVRQLDSKICNQRNVRFIAFNLIKCDKEFDTMDGQFDFLKEQGFEVVGHYKVNKNTIKTIFEEYTRVSKTFKYPVDGLVVGYNDLKYRKSLGSTSHHPLGWYAIKWQDSTKETILRDIQFQVGRTGVLTPVALFDEVELEGTIVSKASLHNISILKSLELGMGDTITVYKANMIIPQVDENLTRSNAYKLPTKCPVCGGEIEIKTSEQAEFLYCTNSSCNAKLSQKIKHYCSKTAMNIDGFSIKTIEKFIDKGFIKDITDIYKLEQHKDEIINMEGFGVKSYNKLIESINNSKQCNLANFIFALGIPNVGLSTAKSIADKFKTIYDFINAKNSEIINISDIGDITTESILQYRMNNLDLILGLLEYIAFKEEEKIEANTNEIFSGKKIYATGTFANYKKDELKKIIEDLGGEFASGYAKSLSYLVVGSVKGSSKEAKAIKDGIPVLSEEQFNQMIGK